MLRPLMKLKGEPVDANSGTPLEKQLENGTADPEPRAERVEVCLECWLFIGTFSVMQSGRKEAGSTYAVDKRPD